MSFLPRGGGLTALPPNPLTGFEGHFDAGKERESEEG